MYLHFSISYISDGKYKFRNYSLIILQYFFYFSQEKLVVSTIAFRMCSSINGEYGH